MTNCNLSNENKLMILLIAVKWLSFTHLCILLQAMCIVLARCTVAHVFFLSWCYMHILAILARDKMS